MSLNLKMEHTQEKKKNKEKKEFFSVFFFLSENNFDIFCFRFSRHPFLSALKLRDKNYDIFIFSANVMSKK